MQIETANATQLIDIPLGCGEGPCWAAHEQALYFVDIPGPVLYRYDPATKGITSWTLPSAVGSFGLVPDGRFVVALKDGIYIFDPRTKALDLLCRPEPERPENRMNDGKIGPDGRFYVGTMDDRAGDKEPIAALYRVDISGRFERIVTGLIVSNGLAWSPDGRTMFHSDSRQRFLQAFDFDPVTGAIANQRRLRTFEEQDGRPDGAACDAEGYYWSAGVSAGVLNRIAPDGTIVRKVAVPVASPTMPCFGGPDLRTLYVTSLATDRLGPKQFGTLIALDVGVAGAPVARFGEPLKL